MNFVVKNIKGLQSLMEVEDYNGETEIIIPEDLGIRRINKFSLTDESGTECSSNEIKAISIPHTVEYIGSNAFSSFNFTNVYIPHDSRLKCIGESAFMNCTRLESIYIPSSIDTISFRAFRRCQNLKDVIFGDNSNLRRIRYMAFSESGIEEIQLPSTVNKLVLEAHSFSSCQNLKVLDMSKANVVSIGASLCLGDSQLARVCFPKPLEIIDDYAFQYVNVDNFNLAVCDNLQLIGVGAFSDDCIKNFTLPYFNGAKISENTFSRTKGFSIEMLLSSNPFVEVVPSI